VLPEGLGDLQTFKAPAPELALAKPLWRTSALGVFFVVMPRIDGIQSASEATVRHDKLHNERKFALADASRRFFQSNWTNHG